MRVIRSFFRELLLQSGQFALFYLLIQFSSVGLNLFTDVGHSALLGILVLQTLILAQWGNKPWVRFFGSLVAPLFYTFLEALDGGEFLLNSAHAGFWVFSVVTGALQAGVLKTAVVSLKVFLEFLLTFLNVVIFILLYFYFDTQNSGVEKGELTVLRIFTHLDEFFSDPTHVYVVAGGLLLALGLSLGRSEVLRLKDRINTLFGQYVDTELRDEILAGRGIQSRKVEIAILFSDLRNFTACSEKATPEAVTRMLNLYFTQWNQVVRRHDGVVDKFIGDAVMVLFGLKGTDACEAAVACGREMLSSWPAIREQLVAEGLPVPDGLGIGVHFGTAILGDIGSEDRRNFTVIGDTVNSASRIESACKTLGKPFLVSQEVYRQLGPATAALCVDVGRFQLKGKESELALWAVG